MQRHHTMKHLLLQLITLTSVLVSVLPVEASVLTQRDWMKTLVDVCGWSYGLPDEPQDPDYINILTGNRQFRFEAEDVYDRDYDSVSLMSFRNYGPFSGPGWLRGGREATDTHLRFTLPIAGDYLVQARLRRPGHQIAIAGKTSVLDAGESFSTVNVGTFTLQAGKQEIVVTLPPGAAIDYITLAAPNLAAITPTDSWEPDKPLTWEVVQTTLLQLLDLAELFPSDPQELVIEAEELTQTAASVVSIPHLGKPSEGKWLRASPFPATVSFPISPVKSTFYDLTLRTMGAPIRVTVAGHQQLDLQGKPYLDDHTFRPLFLLAGKSAITLELPAGGGVDQLRLSTRRIDAAATASLLGFGQSGEPTDRDLDNLTSLLAAFGVER